MPRPQLSGTAVTRHSPSRTATRTRPPTAPRRAASTTGSRRVPGPSARHAGLVHVLVAALAGGGVVAGHVTLGEQGVHAEELALQAFGTGEPGTAAREALVPPAPREPSAGAAVSDDPLPPVDVDALTGVAIGAADSTSAARERAERAAAEATERPAPEVPTAEPPTAERPSPERAAGPGPASCAAGTEGFGDVAEATARAGEKLRCMFGVETVHGVAGRASTSDHPKGKALDFMVDRATGDRLAAYARQNMDELGISYVIYRQRIDTGDGWETQEDRGGDTANHMDHVHISFD